MISGEALRARRILRSAPWLPLVGSAVAGSILFLIAAVAPQTALASLTSLLALSTCGGAAAYLLDEEAGPVADATPTSHRRRAAWRMVGLLLPGAVAIGGLVALDGLDPRGHWLRLAPLAAGSLGIGVGLAAVLRRAGVAAPGDQAAVLTLVTTLTIVVLNPLRRWVQVVPQVGDLHAGRSVALWVVLLAGCAGVALVCTRDPGRSAAGRGRRVATGQSS